MAEVMIWNPIERLLWGVAITLLFISGLLYFLKGKKREDLNEKLIMYGFTSILIGFAFSALFFYFSELTIPGHFENDIFYGDFNEISYMYIIFYSRDSSSSATGCGCCSGSCAASGSLPFLKTCESANR